MKAETVSVRPLPDYDTRAVRIANEILARADRFCVAGTAFTMRHLVELLARLEVFAEERGPARILLWPDPARTSADAIARLLAIEGAEVAFARSEPQFGATDFLIFDGKGLTVLATSLRQVYPELCAGAEGGGMVQHARPEDDAAQEVIARFERCWSGAQVVDEELLAVFREKVEACTTRFEEGDLVRSTNDLYRGYGVGRIQKLRGGHAKVEFNPSVFMQPPYRSENKILQLEELEKVDSPLARAAAGCWEEPWRFELRMLGFRDRRTVRSRIDASRTREAAKTGAGVPRCRQMDLSPRILNLERYGGSGIMDLLPQLGESLFLAAGLAVACLQAMAFGQGHRENEDDKRAS